MGMRGTAGPSRVALVGIAPFRPPCQLPMASPTLRTLARSLGLSHATISAALNQTGRVKAETAERVRRAAAEAGYRANPLTSAVMSGVRQSRASTFRGIMAAVEIAEFNRPADAVRYHAELAAGATERAASLGFRLEQFLAGPNHVPMRRLAAILRARGIQGIVLLPAWNEPDLSELDWSHFAGVYADYALGRPALPSVYPDHYRGMMMTLEHLRSLGYRRPGLFIAQQQDERIQHRWEAAFLAFDANRDGVHRAIPRLKTSGPDRAEFIRWFQRHRPDVVLGHTTDAIAWMEEAGAVVPDQHGFVCLNLLRARVPCAGLNLQPRLVGSLAVEQLVAQLHRHEIAGLSRLAPSISVPPAWVDGPTVRPAVRTDLAPLAFEEPSLLDRLSSAI